MNGGCDAFDENGLLWESTAYSSLVQYILQRESPLGEDGPRWTIHFQHLGFTVLVMDPDDEYDDLLRMLAVFCPFCNMLFSKAGVRIDWNKLKSSDYTAKSAQLAKYFFDQLRTPDALLFVPEGFDTPLADCILYAFNARHVYNIQFAHMTHAT
jgi:hypothetical protein